jgi:D-3-phosphoglycerate dehydrogenase
MLMGENGINIARMQFGRETAGGRAMSVVSIDSTVSEAIMAKVRQLPNVLSVKQVKV